MVSSKQPQRPLKQESKPTRRSSQRRPEVIRVKVPRKLLIQIHNMHIPLAIVPHHRPPPLTPILVPLNINPQAPIHLQPQEHLVVHGVPPPRGLVALHPLQLQLLQARAQVRGPLRQALRLDLGVAGGLGRAELLRVEAGDLGRVVRRRVARHQVVVLRGERVELPRELLEGGLGVVDAQVARLLQGRDGVVDAPDGEFVRVDVEVVDGVVDELARVSCASRSFGGVDLPWQALLRATS